MVREQLHHIQPSHLINVPSEDILHVLTTQPPRRFKWVATPNVNESEESSSSDEGNPS